MTLSNPIQSVSAVVIVLLCGLLLTGCLPASYFFRSPKEVDISSEPYFTELFGHAYAFKTDVFIYKFDDPANYNKVHISPPGLGSDLPSSVAEYERDPKNWKLTDTWAIKAGDSASVLMRSNVIGIVRAGTQFTIDQVVHRTYPSGTEINTIYITIDGYDPKGSKVDARDIFNKFGSEFGKSPSALDARFVTPVLPK